MKVLLYLATPGGLTGAPRRLLTLAGALRNNGVDVCVACEEGTELMLRARELGFETSVVPLIGVLELRGGALFGGGLFFRARAALALIVQNLRFCLKVHQSGADVVWIRASKGIAFAGLGAMLARRSLIWDVDYELPSRGAVRFLHRFGLSYASAVVFQYKAAPDSIFGLDLANRYRKRLYPITPGIDLRQLREVCGRCEARGNGGSEPFVILQVGSLCDRKNQLFLLDVLNRLSSLNLPRQVEVFLVGGLSDAAYVDEVKKAIDKKGLNSVVKLLGWRNDVHKLMQCADLLVMPSKDEGVPNAIQEAMFLKVPVLVSNRGGMPEIVSNQTTGWVLSLQDADSWAVQIKFCMEHPQVCTSIAGAAHVHAENFFGTQCWGEKYSDIIKKVFQENSV